MKYIVDHIPTDNRNRPCKKMLPTTITIHNTDNTAPAKNERLWLTNPENKRIASWHICVDANEAYEAIPLNECAYHAGNDQGNNTSIGIEICMGSGFEQAILNTVELVVKMLKERGWGIDRLRRHYDWSGKNCPSGMSANNWKKWFEFKQMVADKLNDSIKPKVYVNNILLNAEAIIKDGRVYAPVRAIGEAVGAKVGYNLNTKKPSINGIEINDIITVNGITYTPVRTICEILKLKFDWFNDTKKLKVWKV